MKKMQIGRVGSDMKKIFSLKYHKEKIQSIISPDLPKMYAKERTDKEIFQSGLSLFVYSYVVYVFIYISMFLLGYPYFCKLNELMKTEFELKGYSSFSLFLNSYPWNVLYILASLTIFLLLTSVLSYALIKIFEDGIRGFRVHFGYCLHAMSILMSCLLVVFIANSIFPFDQQVGVIRFGFLVSIWVLMFLIGTYLTTVFFIRASHVHFDQHKRRIAIAWLLPFLFVMYTIVGIVIGV